MTDLQRDIDIIDGLFAPHPTKIQNPATVAAWQRIRASLEQAPTAAAVHVNRNTLDHVARLLELSDHHLTNGPHPIERRITYWRAQAAVAIGGVNELAAANKENTND